MKSINVNNLVGKDLNIVIREFIAIRNKYPSDEFKLIFENTAYSSDFYLEIEVKKLSHK